ncbi:MAG: hypothetical protein ACP5HJ_03795, partial [Candidatus Micrarchaeia archaeon]
MDIRENKEDIENIENTYIVIFVGGKNKRMKRTAPYSSFNDIKVSYPIELSSKEGIIPIFEKLIKDLEGIGGNIYLLSDNKEKKEKIGGYVKRKGIGAECTSKNIETKDRLLFFGEKKSIIDKPVFLLIVAGDSIFEGKENISVNEEIKDFVEKAKELIENKGTKVVWGVIPQENYKGGEESLKNQTKCVVDENNRVISARKNCEPKEGEKLFASLIFARADIFFRLIKKAKDVHDIY